MKRTKVIQHKSTWTASSRTARAKCTENPSPALKNTSPPKTYWAHERGLDSEKHVQKFYERKGYELLGQRVKTPFAEVDLIFKTPEGHALMVEVKTANIADFQPHRISQRQKTRQLRALQFLAERLDSLVEAHWAFVTKEGVVTIIEDISG
ncbi:YraN family protein [Bdellovibrio sp. BCCA]|uniref:YraN family protein n=1 Tax=Bdellovibrio sp. BCCA TaxID=3136281 RepID=UPI0030F2D2EB